MAKTTKFEDYLITPELCAHARKKLYSNYNESDSGMIDVNGNPLTKCKLWQGGTLGKGYGAVYIKKINGVQVVALTHRLAWFLENGSVPSFDNSATGLNVLHGECNNRRCFEHISLGVPKENTQHRIRDNTDSIGTKNPNVKLTESEVMEIYHLSHSGLYTQNEIGDRFNIDQSTVSDIKRKVLWQSMHEQ